MTLITDRRGSVSLMSALLAPPLIMVLALAVEVTSWSLTKVELQRIADIAAWAGAQAYAGTADARAATGVGVDLAELNGVAGAVSRTWNASTLATSDTRTTAQVIPGIRNTSGQAMKVSVSRVMVKSFADIFPSASPFITVTAVSIVEATAAVGLLPCAEALSRAGGSSATTVSMSGSAKIVAQGCSVRANGGMALSGSSIIDVPEIDAAGAIVTSDTAYVSGKVTLNAAQATDPLAGYAPLQNALATLPGGGPAVLLVGSLQQTINPGNYASIDVSGSAILTLNPGLYAVSGNVNLGGSAIIAGSQATIISTGKLTVVGSATISATQPDATSKAGGIAGILFASRSTLASSISGSATVPAGGTFYYPNGDFSLSGSFAAGTSGCTRFIASTFSMSGSASITTDCTSGTAAVATAQPTIAFVQ